MEEKTARVGYRCKKCFKNWSEEVPFTEENWAKQTTETICEYCSQPNRTSTDILHRMVEVMPTARPFDFPQFINLLMKHVVLKE